MNSVISQKEQSAKKFEYRGYAREKLAKRKVKVKGEIVKKYWLNLILKKELKNALVFFTPIFSKWTQLFRKKIKTWESLNIVDTRESNPRSVKVKWEEEFWMKIG